MARRLALRLLIRRACPRAPSSTLEHPRSPSITLDHPRSPSTGIRVALQWTHLHALRKAVDAGDEAEAMNVEPVQRKQDLIQHAAHDRDFQLEDILI